MRLLCLLGTACQDYHDKHVRKLECDRIQCDEIWSFVGCKEQNMTPDKRKKGRGDCWTWTALDPDTKLLVSWRVGLREARDSILFMEDLASRLSKRVQITTDGHIGYLAAVENAFGAEVDYATAIKLFHRPQEEERIEARYSPSRCKEVKKKVISGNPDAAYITTSHNERNNLTIRMQIRRFTRLTNAFSKKMENHAHAVALHFMHYNYCRIHQTLRMTPAMASGLARSIWEIDDLVALLDSGLLERAA